MPGPEQQILQTWHTNAGAWTNAIQQQSIESRRLVTNQAIIEAIVQCQPKYVLDAGCGEGWLCRELQAKNIITTGTDAISGLINAAKEKGNGDYFVFSYQQIIEGNFEPSILFDVIVFNFSLFGNELVNELLPAIKKFLTADGKLVIQTLHPFAAQGAEPYKDGWREGSWSGFSNDFKDPAPWYYRTMQSWFDLFTNTGYRLHTLMEPIHPSTGLPASAIFVCRPV